jgi:RHS repeat-associated protein
MGGQKPYLLVKTVNNLGAETRVHYVPSTKFYLADKLAGKPWITRLPFPVHVVERVETYDHISRNRFVTRYAYHHGFYDGVEREFRGFGMVEQFDTEEFAALNRSQQLPVGTNVMEFSHVPPVLTRTWFHTGVYFGRDHVSNFFAGLLDANDLGEYYREPGLSNAEAQALLLEDTVLPAGLSIDEEREACRALKGSILRKEVYALDGSDKQSHPYTVTEQNLTIRVLQRRLSNRQAVCFAHARESISYHYERRPADPRISHSLTIEVDDYGNVLKSAAVGYGRRQSAPVLNAQDQIRQNERLITYTENAVTNCVNLCDDYRAPLHCESRTYELTGLVQVGSCSRFTLTQLETACATAAPINYEQSPTSGVLQKRLIEHVRTIYRRNDLTGALTLGDLQSLALPFESYRLAFSPGLIAQVYGGRVSDGMLKGEGRYVNREGEPQWWIPSGRVFYSAGNADDSHQEIAHARVHFFLPHRYQNPFHTNLVSNETFVAYDGYNLLVQETRDVLGNRITVGERNVDPTEPLLRHSQDYRVLQPALVMDPNRNCSAVAFDALGIVVGTAVMSKPEDNPRGGDLLDGFESDLTEAAILDHLADPLADAHTVLQRATTRLVYDLFAYQRTKKEANLQPAVSYVLARETHESDLLMGEQTKIQHGFTYSDGFGREIQSKVQAEPGPVPERDPAIDRVTTFSGHEQPETPPNDVRRRWVASGWTVFNNKGKPVRQYEPFFTNTHRFEFDVRVGVSPVLFYDPVERLVATLHPNHTWEKVVFDPWRQETWDVNDTVLITDPKNDADVGDFFRRIPDSEYMPTWHAQQWKSLAPEEQAAASKTAAHANTPTVAHFDSLGRTLLTVTHNKFKREDTLPADPPIEEFYGMRVLFDIEGNQRAVVDALDRVVMRYDYDMLGNRVHEASMEAGERWMLNDVAGKPLRAWDSRDHGFRTVYDQLRRPTESYLREGSGPERLVGRTVYGETRSKPESGNLRGCVVQVFDQAGVVTTDQYDFKGNLLHSQRQLANEYKTTLDWSLTVPLEEAIYRSFTHYDALNRPTEVIAPDNTVIRTTYNEANLLEEVQAKLGGAAITTVFVAGIEYDAKGQRRMIHYGNGVRTTYEYDLLTFRLIHLLTQRDANDFPGDCPPSPPAGWPGCQLQNLYYTYDAFGNITHIRDDAQQMIYFRNTRVQASAEYTCDSVYRLIEATGREHLGQVASQPSSPDAFNAFHTRLNHPFDGNALGRYVERYVYDAVGNVVSMQHRSANSARAGWTRNFAYTETSQIESGKINNRLSSTTLGETTETYRYDSSAGLHGNITQMPHLPRLEWDYLDQLKTTVGQVANNGTPETTWYVYDAGGQRVRKVIELQAGGERTPTRVKERIYLGGFEIYREYENQGDTLKLERETLHIMDDKQCIALVETRTKGNDDSPARLVRYQFSNHLGSVGLELDDHAHIISYEEYFPYGSTSYQAVRHQTENTKRYRYIGKERDEETGLYYHGARYYIPWLSRWASCDPAGLADGPNLYRYCRNNPIVFSDPSGMQPPDPTQFRTFEEFGAGVPSPWSNEYLEEVWNAAHPPQSPNDVVYSIAEIEKPGDVADFWANEARPNRKDWAHPLSELEQGYIQAFRDPSVPAAIRMRSPVDPSNLTSEERAAAERLFGSGAGDAEQYANYENRRRILAHYVYTHPATVRLQLGIYRLFRDVNPIHFALERGWQIGSGREMFTEQEVSRLGAAFEFTASLAIVYGVNKGLTAVRPQPQFEVPSGPQRPLTDPIYDLPPEGGGMRINGRWYSEHALERMAPDTPQVRAEIASRTRARLERIGIGSSHPAYNRVLTRAMQKVDPRGVPPSVVEAEIARPGSTSVRVITARRGQVVVTVIPR